MGIVGRVRSIHRYPVKSMQGETVEHAELGRSGLEGDRAFALLDDETGFVVSGKRPKRWGEVLRCVARTVDGSVVVDLPDANSFSIDDPALTAALSDLLGRSVSIIDQAPEGVGFQEVWVRDLKDGVDPPLGRSSDDIDGEEAIVGGTTMSEMGNLSNSGMPHIITTSSLDALSGLSPDSDFDVRRFRPNLLVETDQPGFVENDWRGGVLTIGDVRLQVTFLAPRCVMTTLPFDHLPADRSVLRTITDHNKIHQEGIGALPCIGVYVDVVQSGTVVAGQSVEFSPTAPEPA